jgi:DNA-binding NarL/FixJ family response regulator
LAGNHEGIQLGKQCREKGIPHFFLTSYSDRKTVLKAKNSKPGHYVVKPFTLEEIMIAIEMTLMHSQSNDMERLSKAIEHFNLTKREGQVLNCLAQRLTNQEIGEQLGLSLNTVKFHIRHVYSKTGASTKQELIERIEFV